MKSLGRMSLVLAAVVSILSFAAIAARADSIVFTMKGGVWLVRPDGSDLRRITAAGGPYSYAAQADDGTIMAVREVGGGRDVLVRLRRDGRILNSFLPSLRFQYPTSAVRGVALSPNGKRVAFVTAFNGNSDCSGSGFEQDCHFLGVATASGQALDSDALVDSPAWMNNGRLLVALPGGVIGTRDLGDGEASEWFTGPDPENSGLPDFLYEADITRAGDRLATTSSDLSLPTEPGYQSTNVLYIWTTGGPPPVPPAIECRLGPVAADFRHPSFSPDGTGLAFEIATEETPTGQEGIWVARRKGPGCDSFASSRIVPGGRYPDWGPASSIPGTGGRGRPRFRLHATAKRVQPVRRLGLAVSCNRSCRVTASGTIRLKGRQFRLRTTSAKLGPGKRRKLALRPKRSGVTRNIVRLIRHHRAKAVINVTGRDAHRNRDRATLRVKLKPGAGRKAKAER